MLQSLDTTQSSALLNCGPFWASWLESAEQIFLLIKCLFSPINHYFCNIACLLIFIHHFPKTAHSVPCTDLKYRRATPGVVNIIRAQRLQLNNAFVCSSLPPSVLARSVSLYLLDKTWRHVIPVKKTEISHFCRKWNSHNYYCTTPFYWIDTKSYY